MGESGDFIRVSVDYSTAAYLLGSGVVDGTTQSSWESRRSEFVATGCALMGLAIAIVPDGTGAPSTVYTAIDYTGAPTEFVMPVNGRIWFVFNDLADYASYHFYDDNTGSFIVTTKIL